MQIGRRGPSLERNRNKTYTRLGTTEDIHMEIVETNPMKQRSPTDGPRETFGSPWRNLDIICNFMFIIILFHYIIMLYFSILIILYLFQTSSNKNHTNNFFIIKQVHFKSIRRNFHYHYVIDVCTFLKKFMLVVRGIQNCV
jgi:hypothetical protein